MPFLVIPGKKFETFFVESTWFSSKVKCKSISLFMTILENGITKQYYYMRVPAQRSSAPPIALQLRLKRFDWSWLRDTQMLFPILFFSLQVLPDPLTRQKMTHLLFIGRSLVMKNDLELIHKPCWSEEIKPIVFFQHSIPRNLKAG